MSLKSSIASEKRVSQWEELMRKFSEAHKEVCKAGSLDIPRVPRSIKKFPTGSQYEGSWDVLGMSGYGVYTFPNGVKYEGNFEDGVFHGQGDLVYPSGAIIRGNWHKGMMMNRTLIFADNMEYSEHDWKYCRIPDRRFTIEEQTNLMPGCETYQTADQPTRDIPEGFYDTGDGFYNPKTRVICKADDLSAIVRSPSTQEQKWIIENCRTNPLPPLGPRQDLYEQWCEPIVDPRPPQTPSASSAFSSISRHAWSFSPHDQDQEVRGDLFYDAYKKSLWRSANFADRHSVPFMSSMKRVHLKSVQEDHRVFY